MSGVPTDAETERLAVSARLFGRLLVRELDVETLAELEAPPIRAALADLGVEVPARERLDELAHEWLACFLHPDHGLPPVHSLHRGGNYDGDPAVAIRRIAQTAGLELAPGARNAPPDHLGCILLLWAELATTRPELAALVADEHLGFADRALAPAVRGPSGFYAAVARAADQLVAEIRASR